MVWLRRPLAIAELAAAGMLMLLGSDFRTDSKIGSDGIATSLGRVYAVPLMVMAVGVAITGVTAWRGSPRWWVWQLAMPLWLAAALFAVFMWMMIIG